MIQAMADDQLLAKARYWFRHGEGDRDWMAKVCAAAEKEMRRTGNCPGVYAILCGDSVKVGRSDHSMTRRLRQLQTGSSEEMTLLAVLSYNPNDERQCQGRLAPFRLRGEWFRVCDESLAEILMMAQDAGWVD